MFFPYIIIFSILTKFLLKINPFLLKNTKSELLFIFHHILVISKGVIMKKISIILAVFTLFCFSLTACNKTNPLYNSVSDLREIIYTGNTENINLKASYGFKESPYSNDAKVNARIYSLTFHLMSKENENTTYFLSFDFNNNTYSSQFKLNPVSDTLCATVEVESFNLKEFYITLSYGNERHEILLKSILPENTISYTTALDHLYNEQNSLLKYYTDENGNFNAEIHVRILVKDEKPYWYVGIASGGNRLKALLIDGFTGELLAIREVF